jgi:hypothetical protein
MRKAATTAYKELLASHMAMLGATAATTSHQLTTALTIGDTEFDVPVDPPASAAGGGEAATSWAAPSLPAADSPASSGAVGAETPAGSHAAGVRSVAATAGGLAVAPQSPAPVSSPLDMEAVAAAARAAAAASDGGSLDTARVLTGRSAPPAPAAPVAPPPTTAAALLDVAMGAGVGGAAGLQLPQHVAEPLAGLVAAVREHAAVASHQASLLDPDVLAGGAGSLSAAGTPTRRTSATMLGTSGPGSALAPMDVFGLEACLLQRLIDVSHSAMHIAHMLHHDAGTADGAAAAASASRRASRVSMDEGDGAPVSFSALHRHGAAAGGTGGPAPAPTGGSGGGGGWSADFERALMRFRHLNQSLVLPTAGASSDDGGGEAAGASSDAAALVSLTTRLVHLLSALAEYSGAGHDGAASLDVSRRAGASTAALPPSGDSPPLRHVRGLPPPPSPPPPTHHPPTTTCLQATRPRRQSVACIAPPPACSASCTACCCASPPTSCWRSTCRCARWPRQPPLRLPPTPVAHQLPCQRVGRRKMSLPPCERRSPRWRSALSWSGLPTSCSGPPPPQRGGGARTAHAATGARRRSAC